MKVLNILPDERLGGPPLRVLSVAKKLRYYDIDSVIVIPKGDKTFAKLARKEGFKVYQIYMDRFRDPKSLSGLLTNILLPFTILITVYLLKNIIKKESIDIVHSNGIRTLQGIISAKISGVKLVVHLNDTNTPHIMKTVLAPLVLKVSDRIAIAAEAVGGYYFGDAIPEKVSVIYAPVDLNKFNKKNMNTSNIKELRAEFGVDRETLIVGCIGNINPHKGYEYFIYAAEKIKKKVKNVKFLIVGATLKTQKLYHKKLLEKLSKLGLENDILFLGYRNDVVRILSIMDVLVLPSVSEACPQSVLEAMAMEVPAVATDVGGVREEIDDGKNGIVIQPRRPMIMAEKILFLLENQEVRKEMGKSAREKVEEKFSLDRCVEKHRGIYHKVLQQ